MGRDYLEVFAQFLKKRVDPKKAAGAVKVEQRLAAAESMHLDRELAVANALYRFHYFALRLSGTSAAVCTVLPLVAAGRVKLSGAGIARSGSAIGFGDHLSSKPFHSPRICGITSRANSSVFLRTSSGGIEPICWRIIRWPQFRLFIASVRRSRTVF